MNRLIAVSTLILLCFCMAAAGDDKAGISADLTGAQCYEKGMQFFTQGHYQEAAPWLQEATRRQANFREAYLQLGICYMELLDVDKARQSLVAAKFLSKDDEALKRNVENLILKLMEIEEKKKKVSVEQSVQVQEGQEKKQEQESSRVVEECGIVGTVTDRGYLIGEIRRGSQAEKAGLLTGDIITRIGNEAIITRQEQVNAVFQRCKTVRKSELITVSSGGTTRQIGWPPLDEKAITETQVREIALHKAAGAKDLAAGKNQDAIEEFCRALDVSHDYSCRSDLYVELAKAYLPKVLTNWKKELPVFPPKTGNRLDVIDAARKIFDEGTSLYRAGDNSVRLAAGHVQSARAELARKGGGSENKNLPEDIKGVEKQMDDLRTQYGSKREQELKAFGSELEKIDFTRWLKCFGGLGLREERKMNPQKKMVVTYQPVADITFRNLSRETTFESAGQIQVLDDKGQTRSVEQIQVKCPPGEVQRFHREFPGRFQETDVWFMTEIEGEHKKKISVPTSRKRWTAKVIVEGKYFWKFPIN